MADEREYLFVGGPAHGTRLAVPVGMTSFMVRNTSVPAGGCVRAVPRTGREVVMYTRRMISTTEGPVCYFAPDDWSDLQALERLFGADD
jgi:hypothetical protein